MEHQINILTLGVSNLSQMTSWYEKKFGWVAIRKSRRTVLFRVDRLILALVQENQLAQDLCTWAAGMNSNKIVLTIGFNSEKELERKFDELRNNGVTIVKGPRKITGGAYKGLIMDPEDNFWELAYYPFKEINSAIEKFSFYEKIDQS